MRKIQWADLYPMEFSAHWIEDCMIYHGFVLCGDDGHWCHDFDGLPIDKNCEEYQYCHCSEPWDEDVEVTKKETS